MFLAGDVEVVDKINIWNRKMIKMTQTNNSNNTTRGVLLSAIGLHQQISLLLP